MMWSRRYANNPLHLLSFSALPQEVIKGEDTEKVDSVPQEVCLLN